MQDVADQSAAPTTIGADLCAIFVSLELSRSTWLATSLSPGRGEAFTRVAARTLAPSPICDLLHRRLQPFCYLHDCSGCFRLERLPGGACTHWKAPPCHGAHVKRTLLSGPQSPGGLASIRLNRASLAPRRPVATGRSLAAFPRKSVLARNMLLPFRAYASTADKTPRS